MNNNQRKSEADEWTELSLLVDRCLDGRLDEPQIKRLEALLLGNAAAQDYYLNACQLHNLINIENQASRVVDKVRLQLGSLNINKKSRQAKVTRERYSWRPMRSWLTAVTVMAAAASVTIAGLFWLLNTDTHDSNALADRRVQPHDTEGAKRLLNGEWPNDASGFFHQSIFDFGPGIEVLKLRHFGTAILEGPGRAEWISPMRMKLHQGRMKVRIDDPEGFAFTIDTPSATISDLVTEFAIDVSEEQTSTVVVFDGAVDLKYANSITEDQQIKRLYGGDGLMVSAKGVASRLMAIVTGEKSTFSHLTEYVSQFSSPLIVDVSDNVVGLDSKRYYEIVPGGLREDAKAYVDRPAHEWNGLDEGGLPAYLVGIDYIKTYNGDKRRQHLSIDVTLSRAAILYVFFDARLPAPQWLTNDFHDTGDKIGLDMGQWYGPDGKLIIKETSGSGPGISIDAVFTVWARRVEQAGVVRLGSASGPSGLSAMYGIAAEELDESQFPGLSEF